jgi:hypothetical protein
MRDQLSNQKAEGINKLHLGNIIDEGPLMEY